MQQRTRKAELGSGREEEGEGRQPRPRLHMESSKRSEEREWPPVEAQPESRLHVPMPGQYVSGNLWTLTCEERDIPGPLGSFLRHTSSMLSPNLPTYTTVRKQPVYRVSDLRQEPTVENVIAHHSYLEYLQFEKSSLRWWSNMVQNQIMGENSTGA